MPKRESQVKPLNQKSNSKKLFQSPCLAAIALLLIFLGLQLCFFENRAEAMLLSSTNPADDATDVAVNSNLVMTFSQDWVPGGTSGNIELRKADATLIESYSFPSYPATITGEGSAQLTINPSSDLLPSTSYYVTVDFQIIDSEGGMDHYTGFTDNTTWSFTTAAGGGATAPTDWLGEAWTKRMRISINASQVNGSVSNFPVYINLSHMPDSFFDDCLTNGADLRVTKSDGTTEVAREVVWLNKTSNGGELHFVANGTLSNASNGVFYLYYGNGSATEPAAGATYGKNNVWVNNYAGVWHMQEAVNNDAGGYTDSTSYSNNATGVSMALTEVTGKLSGKAQDLDGTADYIYASNSASLEDLMESSFTLSAWHYPDEVPLNDPWYNSFDAIICKQGAHSGLLYEYNAFYMTSTQTNSGYDLTSTPTTYSINTWHHAAFILSTSGTSQTMYVDGTQKATSTYSGSLRDYSTNPFKFGVCGTPGNDWDWILNGKLDEIRISNTNRNGSWIKTEYNNQSSPSTFYAVPSAANSVFTPAVFQFSPSDGATGVAVSDNLVITFDRKIDVQTGNITIKKTADDSTAETIDVTSGQVTGNGTTQITINPTLNFASNTGYYIQIDATAFDDTGGNSYAGIANTTTWNFTSIVIVPSDWLGSAWPNRVKISVNASQVNGSVSNFPVYVNLNHMPGDFFDGCLANGADLHVTKSDGLTQVAREVVWLNKDTNGGELHFVANGTLSNSSNGVFYLYYGNGTETEPAASSTYGKNNVWVNNYAGVWHMQEAVNNTASGYTDSTSYSNHATGTSMALTAVDGKLSGKAQDLDGIADYMSTPDTASLRDVMEASFTLSAWHYPDEVPLNDPWYNSFDGVICREGQHSGILYEYQAFYQVTTWAGGAGYDVTSTPTTFAATTWHHAVQIINTSNTSETLFVDGVQRGATTYSGALRDYSTTPFKFGLCGVAGNDWDWILNGKLDEIRISSTNRNGSWVKTEYNNQSSPSTFYSVASRVSELTPFDVLGFSPADGTPRAAIATNLVITFDRLVDIQTGNVTIKKSSDDSTVETIDVTTGAVTGNGTAIITINPSSNLKNNVSYYIQIDSTAFQDTAGTGYAGISNTTTWNFTTVDVNTTLFFDMGF